MTQILTGLLIMFLLLAANGFFVAVEFALVTVRRSRVQELADKGNELAKMVRGLQDDLDFSIAGAQLGITLASLGLGWVADEYIKTAIEAMIHGGAATAPAAGEFSAPAGIGMALSFVFLSMMHVILGEQVPKSWALRMPERMVIALAIPFRIFCFIASPVVHLMNFLASVILRAIGIPKSDEGSHAISSSSEFFILFEQSREAGAIEEEEHELLHRSLGLKKHTAGELMIPKSEIYWVDITKPYKETLDQLIQSPHQRVVVTRGDIDHIAGFIDVFELLSLLQGKVAVNLQRLVKPVLIVPENRSVLHMVKDFQNSPSALAIVADEYGSVLGMLTANDIVAAIVGILPWEDDEEQVVRVSDLEWSLDGMLSIDEFKELVDWDELPESPSRYYTLAGLVISHLQHIPQQDESFQIKDLQFKILEMDRYRVARVYVRRLSQAQLNSHHELPKAS